jgi:exonuclease VII small subunit
MNENESATASEEQKADDELTQALEATLSNLTKSIERMENIVQQLERGETGWEQSIRLLTEANELALSSSQQLEKAVQDAIYGSAKQGEQLQAEGEGRKKAQDEEG